MRDRIALQQVGVLGSPSSQDGVAGRAFSIANPARDTPQPLNGLDACPLELGACRSMSTAAHEPLGERQPAAALGSPGPFLGEMLYSASLHGLQRHMGRGGTCGVGAAWGKFFLFY